MGSTDKKGRIFVVSAPSGAGKTTLCRILLREVPRLAYSVSYTTRIPRFNEKEGVDYFFITSNEFEKKIESGFWAEWAKVHDNYYGTSKRYIKDQIDAGRYLLLDIDVNGADQIKKTFPAAVTIFIMPPSLGVLVKRLEKRGTDSPAVVEKRVKNAEKEMAKKDFYDFVIVNDDLKKASKKLTAIVNGIINS